jgi:predicted RNase H-like nuclease (RuvC/YqgF family)
MPRSSDNESDDEDEVDASLVHDRTSSTVSMEIHERMEALQRNNEELGRKLMEAERTLQNKLTEHETELEETHMRLEELRSELSLSNREEKELRAKDVRIQSLTIWNLSE